MTASNLSASVTAAAPTSSTLKRVWARVEYIVPILVSLVVFWRVSFTWFRIDDFAETP